LWCTVEVGTALDLEGEFDFGKFRIEAGESFSEFEGIFARPGGVVDEAQFVGREVARFVDANDEDFGGVWQCGEEGCFLSIR
jgi:hypothetical protein